MNIRSILRSVAMFFSAAILATCADSGSAPTAVGGTRAHITLSPSFSKEARAILAQRTSFAAVDFDHVRVLITRVADNVVVLDTTLIFSPDAPEITIDVPVTVTVPGQHFSAELDYTTAGTIVFRGTVQVDAHSADAPAPTPQQVIVAYVGPGANAARVVVSPKTTALVAPSTATFTATAFDATNTPIAGLPFTWATSDSTIATVSAAGIVSTTGKRGTVTITATTPTSLSDTGVAGVTLPATSLVLVSGGGQTGKVGSTLVQPVVVRAIASDGIGVAGVTVNFSPPAGAQVGAAAATTDTSGAATTTMTLGTTAGAQGFAAVAGAFSVGIPATAIPGDPATIAAVSGGGQKDTVKRALKQPFVVKVSDQFGNAIDKATVSWTRTEGSGALGANTSLTVADGTTSMTYTLGPASGSETIAAAAVGAGSTTFTARAVPGAPSILAVVSGGGQIARVLQPLKAPFVVKVTDDAGNPVSDAVVSWSALRATIAPQTTTDTSGQTSNTLTLGSKPGSVLATAAIGSGDNAKSVSFSATAQTGFVAKMTVGGSPGPSETGTMLTPALQVELRDNAGNLTAATNPVTVALDANSVGASLTGTLTRNAVAGVATFDDLAIDQPGVGYTLVATSGGAGSVQTPPFTVFPRGVIMIPWTPLSYFADAGTSVGGIAVRIIDASYTPVVGIPVTFTPAAGSGSVSPGMNVLTDASGVASVVWTLGPVPGPQSVVVSAFNGADVETFTATATQPPGPPVRLEIVTDVATTIQSGALYEPVVQVQLMDAQGRQSRVAAVPITVSITSGTGTLAGQLTVLTDANGRVVFRDLVISGPPGVVTLGFTSPGLTSAGSPSITIIPGSPAALAAYSLARRRTASLPR